jgi:ferric-dicitrate binding protein FerR (iron transport regulator)
MPDEHDDDTSDPRVDRALEAWTALAPPAGFADRVLARVEAPAPRRRLRWLGAVALAASAAATATVALWPAHRATAGALTARHRTVAQLGDRGLAVAEPDTELTWRIAGDGGAELEQRAGNVFYRVERGEPFVVHTPAGDVRVTGTCFRIEVEAMKPSQKMILSGVAGAALASAVLVTVYEGHVVAQTATARTELSAGTRATLDGRTGATLIADAIATAVDDEHASRDQLVAKARVQAQQIAQLRAQLAGSERGKGLPIFESAAADEPGSKWYAPSPERLAAFVADCRVRMDAPSYEDFEPVTAATDENHLKPGEIADYNAAMIETGKAWRANVRALYLEATGDTAGADTLSLMAMRLEIDAKSPPGERNTVMQQIARERAGLATPPADLSKTSVYERLTRAYAQLGDESEAALARRLGPERAKELRGDGWGARMESSGCPK